MTSFVRRIAQFENLDLRLEISDPIFKLGSLVLRRIPLA